MKKKILIILTICCCIGVAICVYLYNTLEFFKPAYHRTNQKLLIAEYQNLDGNPTIIYYILFNKKDICTACYIEKIDPKEGEILDYLNKSVHHKISENGDGTEYSEYTMYRGHTYTEIKENLMVNENCKIKEFWDYKN